MNQSEIQECQRQWRAFLKEWPLEKLKRMTLDQYVIGNGESFCYWLEQKTIQLGGIRGGNAVKFGIYRPKGEPEARNMTDGKYVWAKKMKAVGRDISICMGVTMSFFLSLVGNLMGGHFTVPGFLISFVVSTVISLIIGFIIPMKKVTEGARNLFKLKPFTIGARCVESLTSDLIYTPIMTLIMVFMAWK